MTTTESAPQRAGMAHQALEVTIRIGLVVLLVFWCFSILKPFLIPVLWGAIIAVGIYPVFRRFRALVGERDKIAAVLFVLIALALLIVPTVLLTESAVTSAQGIAKGLEDGTLVVPPPPEHVKDWPVIGTPVDGFWSLASENLSQAVERAGPQLRTYGGKALSIVGGLGLVVVQFVISILIAGAFLARPSSGRRGVEVVVTRLVGPRGGELVELARSTIVSVLQGVVGVALIQATAGGLGMLAAGVPAAGLLAVLVLVLAVIQLPPLLILGPAALYVFSASSTTTAVLFLIWAVAVSASDTFLKPLFLGRGVDVPMLVILLGALGGMMSTGIIGLFVGAVVMAVSFKLFQAWLEMESAEATASPGETGT